MTNAMLNKMTVEGQVFELEKEIREIESAGEDAKAIAEEALTKVTEVESQMGAIKVKANQAYAYASEALAAAQGAEVIATAAHAVADAAQSTANAAQATAEAAQTTAISAQTAAAAAQADATDALEQIADIEAGDITSKKAECDAAGNVITETYATKTALSDVSGVANEAMAHVEDILGGGEIVAKAYKADCDSVGNNIQQTYATQSDHSTLSIRVGEIISGDIVTGEASKATYDSSGLVIEAQFRRILDGTDPPDKAVSAKKDYDGNIITDTYATKAALEDVVDGTVAVEKAVCDAAGNTIETTYAKMTMTPVNLEPGSGDISVLYNSTFAQAGLLFVQVLFGVSDNISSDDTLFYIPTAYTPKFVSDSQRYPIFGVSASDIRTALLYSDEIRLAEYGMQAGARYFLTAIIPFEVEVNQ